MQIYADSKGKVAVDDVTLWANCCTKCHGNTISRFHLIAYYVTGWIIRTELPELHIHPSALRNPTMANCNTSRCSICNRDRDRRRLESPQEKTESQQKCLVTVVQRCWTNCISYFARSGNKNLSHMTSKTPLWYTFISTRVTVLFVTTITAFPYFPLPVKS